MLLKQIRQNHGNVSGLPLLNLRGEGILVLLMATFAYSQMALGWLIFALLFFVPDVFMVGYLRNSKIGAAVYNVGHSYIVPGAMLMASNLIDQQQALAISLIWIAHIGFDRALGYGLKYGGGFRQTHLSWL